MADELEALPAIFMDEYLEEPSLPHVGFTVRLNCDQLEVKLIGSASSLSLSPFSLSPLPALLWLSVVIPLFSLLSSFFRSLSLSLFSALSPVAQHCLSQLLSPLSSLSLPPLPFLWLSIVSPLSSLLCPLPLSTLPSLLWLSIVSPHSSAGGVFGPGGVAVSSSTALTPLGTGRLDRPALPLLRAAGPLPGVPAPHRSVQLPAALAAMKIPTVCSYSCRRSQRCAPGRSPTARPGAWDGTHENKEMPCVGRLARGVRHLFGSAVCTARATCLPGVRFETPGPVRDASVAAAGVPNCCSSCGPKLLLQSVAAR